MVDLREHFHRFLDRPHDVVDVGLQEEDGPVIIGRLGEIGDHLAAFLEPFFGLVLLVMHPVRFRIVGARFRDHVAGAETTGVADDLLEIADPLLALGLIGVNDVGVAGDAADGQIVPAKRVAHFFRLVRRDLAGGEVDVLEMKIELNGVEIERADFLRRLFQAVGKIPGEYACLHHDFFLPLRLGVDRYFGELDSAAALDRAIPRFHQRHRLHVVGDG